VSGWRRVYDFWFPPGLDTADIETHRRLVLRWFGGGANAEMPPFAAVLADARAGRLDAWRSEPLGRLALIIVLDQFPRGLNAGTPEAYAADPDALALAEEGLANGHYNSLARAWEKTFFMLPFAHAEGADHLARLDRVIALAETIAAEAPPALSALYAHSVSQARGHRDVIARFKRYPHRNRILGRTSTPAEEAYIAAGDFVHLRAPPV
jgi:uncharacterized protein (DUF924 family)